MGVWLLPLHLAASLVPYAAACFLREWFSEVPLTPPGQLREAQAWVSRVPGQLGEDRMNTYDSNPNGQEETAGASTPPAPCCSLKTAP